MLPVYYLQFSYLQTFLCREWLINAQSQMVVTIKFKLKVWVWVSYNVCLQVFLIPPSYKIPSSHELTYSSSKAAASIKPNKV